MKGRIAAGICAGLVAVSLTACASSATSDEVADLTAPATTAPSTPTTPITPQAQTIINAVSRYGELSPQQLQIVAAAANAFVEISNSHAGAAMNKNNASLAADSLVNELGLSLSHTQILQLRAAFMSVAG